MFYKGLIGVAFLMGSKMLFLSIDYQRVSIFCTCNRIKNVLHFLFLLTNLSAIRLFRGIIRREMWMRFIGGKFFVAFIKTGRGFLFMCWYCSYWYEKRFLAAWEVIFDRIAFRVFIKRFLDWLRVIFMWILLMMLAFCAFAFIFFYWGHCKFYFGNLIEKKQ